MKTREQLDQEVRAAHADWDDDQVKAEVDRLDEEQRKPDPDPAPKPDAAAFARLRREKQEAESRAKAAQDRLAAEETRKAEEQGEWEKLAKQYEAERDQAREDLASLEQRVNVERIAGRLKVKHPADAIALLPGEVDHTDDQAVEQALQALIDDGRVPVDSTRPGSTGRPAGNGGGALTVEQIKEMSPDEVNRRWDEIQPVLAQQK